ncbi:TPA: LuxR C-terminal-related transcriptional regulator [Serratia fonticola]
MITSTIGKNTPSQAAPAVCHINRVLLMDPCPVIRAGIDAFLSSQQFQVGDILQAEKIRDVALIMQRCKVDLVIAELCGEGESVLDGLRTINHLRQRWPLTPIIVATTLHDTRMLAQLIPLGATGIYLKQDPLTVLTHVLLRGLAGLHSLSPLAAILPDKNDLPPPLTGREMDVLECLFAGKNVTATARALNRDVRTVSTHKRNAMYKLGFHNDCDLYTSGNYLSRNGLLI